MRQLSSGLWSRSKSSDISLLRPQFNLLRMYFCVNLAKSGCSSNIFQITLELHGCSSSFYNDQRRTIKPVLTHLILQNQGMRHLRVVFTLNNLRTRFVYKHHASCKNVFKSRVKFSQAMLEDGAVNHLLL